MPTTDPRRFRHRTAEVQAVQWTGSNEAEMVAFCSPFDFQTIDPEDRIENPDQTAAMRESKHGTWQGMAPGDWAVRIGQEYYELSAADFAERYEPAAPSPPATDRATVLLEAADDLATAFGDPTAKHIGILAASYLRRRAREAEAAPTTEAQPEAEPETPLEKRLRFSERRNDELRTECLRRGKTVAERGEKIRELEKQLDEVRSQLGAEILRAGQAEAELRRMADEAQQSGSWTADGRLKPHTIPAATTPDVPSMTGGFDGSIEIPDLPAVGARQPDTETQDGWCKCPSCWGWFVEDHPGEDLDELGRDLGWWSGLPEHRDPPAGAGGAGGVADHIVAYRSDGGRQLNCLRHVPPPAARHADFRPVTSDDLPDGGVCTYPGCGADVLIPQQRDTEA